MVYKCDTDPALQCKMLVEHIRIPVVREDVDTNVVIHFHVVSTNEVIQLLVDMNLLIHFHVVCTITCCLYMKLVSSYRNSI